MDFRIYFTCILFLGPISLLAQEYILGESYTDPNGFVEYTHGNLPLIISVPHGGELKPAEIPDRNCNGCVYVNDAFTQELARAVVDAMFRDSGCLPHLVINKLHRSKLDANRAVLEAADGNPLAEDAWTAYHNFVDIAMDSINAHYDRGLFIDLHGHAHTVQRLELGYLLSKSNLQLDDEDLDKSEFVEKSSIRNLVSTNDFSFSLSELVRGENSFGHEISIRGYDAVPSPDDHYPESNESYFSGGYNTAQYGSRDKGTIDAIQIECNQDVRFNTAARTAFAQTLAIAIKEFQNVFYNTEIEPSNCFVLNTNEEQDEAVQIFPNPASEYFELEYKSVFHSVSIFNLYGERVLQFRKQDTRYDISALIPGTYTVRLEDLERTLVQKLVVIR